MYRLAILFVLAGILATPMAYAQHPNAKVALHIQTHVTKGSPCPAYTPAVCSTFVTEGDISTNYDIYMIIAQGDEFSDLAGVTVGIAYEGSTVATGTGIWNGGFTLCADLEFPQTAWPETGSGNVITFDAISNCQNGNPGDGTQALIGAFYVYAYEASQFALINHPASDKIAVANCSASENDIPATSAGFVDFGGNLGCNPCLASCVPTPVEETTWGSVKTLFKGEE